MIKGKFRAWLSFYVVTLSFVFIFLITLSETAQQAKTNDIVLGFILGTGLAAIIAFYYGSNDTPPKIDGVKDEKDPL